MDGRANRRAFLNQAIRLAGFGLGLPLLAACAQQAPTPAKPAEAPKAPAPPPPAPAAAASPATAASPPPSPSPAAAAAAPAVTGPVKKIIYGIVSYNPFHSVVIVGTEKPELMRKHGLEIDLVITGTAPAAVQAIVGGSMNMTTTSPDSGWPAQDLTPGLMQVLGIAVGLPYVLIAAPSITKVADLKGKTVAAQAVRGGADTTALRLLLLENGLQDTDYTILPSGSIAERAAAMKSGQVFGTAQIEPQATVLKKDGYPELDACDNYPALRSVHSVTGIAKKEWYEPNADIVRGFLRGWVEITKWIYDPANRAETEAIYGRTMKVDAEAAKNTYERFIVKSKTLPETPRIDKQLMENFAAQHRRIGTPNVPADQAKYIDTTMVEKALAG